MGEKLKHLITFSPAWDKRSTDHGIHCVEMVMAVIGKKGAISFKVFTGWFLPANQADIDMNGPFSLHHGNGADLSYHSKKPLTKWQNINEPSSSECCFLGTPCWSDGSTLNAEKLFREFVEKGEDYVWKTLENYYHSVFGHVTVSKDILNLDGRLQGFKESI